MVEPPSAVGPAPVSRRSKGKAAVGGMRTVARGLFDDESLSSKHQSYALYFDAAASSIALYTSQRSHIAAAGSSPEQCVYRCYSALFLLFPKPNHVAQAYTHK